MAPRWSPDHKKIAFSGWGGDHLRIFVMNADGTGLTQLTSGNFHGYQPAWSPDGTRLAFTGEVDSASVADLYVMKANGSGVVQLTTGASAYEPSWSPDGQKVVYAAYATGPRELYVISVNVANPVPTQLTFDGNQRTHGSPKYSADGSKIIYDSRSPYTLQTGIFIMDANGLNSAPVQTGLTFSSSPSFSPDGKSIAFTGDAPGGIDNRAIYTVKLNGSSLKKVSTGFQPNGNPSWDQTPSWTWD
jgi:Tol biopolymer transport system component